MIELTTLQEGLERIGREASKVYEDYFKTKTIFENLEQQTKTILAEQENDINKTAISNELKVSQVEINRLGLIRQEYKTHLKGLAEAREDFNQAYAKVKSLETRLEVYRSLNRHFSNADI